jgi:hypothetical protein
MTIGALPFDLPTVKATGTPKASGGARASDLGMTRGAGGIGQVNYKGHPLFSFASLPTKSGQTNGEAETVFYVVSPSGHRIATATTTTSSSGAYGY